MRHVAGYSMIGAGLWILTTSLFMKLGGFTLLLKIMMAISVKNAPLNETLIAWVEVPLPMSIQATLSKIQLLEEDGFLAVQHVDFTLKLNSEGFEQAGVKVIPVIFGPEEAAIDDLQRHVIRAGPLNYPCIISYFFAFGSLIVFLVTVGLRFRKSSDDKGPTQNHPMQFFNYSSK